MYSFALSMQSSMTIFITAISQPLYPKLASGGTSKDFYGYAKTGLLIFGSFSGLAYFACSIIVKLFIPKYIDSLSVIAIFFAVFPALAVINTLYINLYKVERKIKKYVFVLVGVIITSIILNILALLLKRNYISIRISSC